MTSFKDGRTVSKLVAFSKMERDLDEVRRLLNNVSSDRMLESENREDIEKMLNEADDLVATIRAYIHSQRLYYQDDIISKMECEKI